MSIEIRKYQFVDGNQKNYFDNPTYIDTLILNKILIEGFPTYNEEHEKQFESFSYSASDFDIKFSLAQGETSSLGKSIEQFFTDDIDNHCLIIKIELERVIGGEIDIESIWFNKTYPEGKYEVKLTVFGFEKTMKEFANKRPFLPTNGISPAFNLFLNNSFFFDGPSSYVNFDCSALDWLTVTADNEPYLVHELWEKVLTYMVVGTSTIWGLFKDLLKYFGLVYRFEINGTHLNYFRITIYLKFRNAITETVTVESETLEHGYIINKERAPWQFFKMAKVHDSNNEYYGILSDGIDALGTHKYLARGKPIVGGPPFIFIEHALETDNILKIYNDNAAAGIDVQLTDVNINEFSHYFLVNFFEPPATTRKWIFTAGQAEYVTDPRRTWKDYSFPAMWTRQGYVITDYGSGTAWKLITHPANMFAIMGVHWVQMIRQYKFLYKQFIYKVYKLRLILTNTSAYKLFVSTVVNGTDLVLYKLLNRDEYNRKVDSVWYQDIS